MRNLPGGCLLRRQPGARPRVEDRIRAAVHVRAETAGGRPRRDPPWGLPLQTTPRSCSSTFAAAEALFTDAGHRQRGRAENARRRAA